MPSVEKTGEIVCAYAENLAGRGGTAHQDLSHRWVAAATIDLSERMARQANVRGYFRAERPDPLTGERVALRVDALDVYCKDCRRTYDDVADLPCEAKIDNSHLVGGHPEERRKRRPQEPPAGATRLSGARITRRGIDAVVAGGAV